MADQIFIDTQTGTYGDATHLRIVDIAEGDLEYLGTCSDTQINEYGLLNGVKTITVQEAADWIAGINADLRWAFLAAFDPQPDEED